MFHSFSPEPYVWFVRESRRKRNETKGREEKGREFENEIIF